MSKNALTDDTERQAQNHAVIILASGLSQRLGQPKQLLLKNGEPLIIYMTRLALTTDPKVIVVVIPDSHRLIARSIEPLVTQHSVIRVAINAKPDTGMADSLLLGIETITDFEDRLINRVIIMGVDQILLDAPHLTALLAGKQAVVASHYHNWQSSEEYKNLDKLTSDTISTTSKPKNAVIGLPLVINYKLLRQWQVELAGDKGLRYLIRGLPFNQIGKVDNDQLTYDIDTPEQLMYATQQGWLDD